MSPFWSRVPDFCFLSARHSEYRRLARTSLTQEQASFSAATPGGRCLYDAIQPGSCDAEVAGPVLEEISRSGCSGFRRHDPDSYVREVGRTCSGGLEEAAPYLTLLEAAVKAGQPGQPARQVQVLNAVLPYWQNCRTPSKGPITCFARKATACEDQQLLAEVRRAAQQRKARLPELRSPAGIDEVCRKEVVAGIAEQRIAPGAVPSFGVDGGL